MILLTLGDRLRRLRGKRTQQDIADILGISRARYSHYENNHVEPDHELLKKMSSLYQVTTDYLLSGVGVQKTNGSAYALPESEINRIVSEIEEEQHINLRDNPLAQQAVRNALELIAKALKSSE